MHTIFRMHFLIKYLYSAAVFIRAHKYDYNVHRAHIHKLRYYTRTNILMNGWSGLMIIRVYSLL